MLLESNVSGKQNAAKCLCALRKQATEALW
jgi:hypothetical protein